MKTKNFVILFGGFFVLSFIVAYLVPSARGPLPLLDSYSSFVSTFIPMIRRIGWLSIRLNMAPAYYFSLMWIAAFVLYLALLRCPHDYFLSPEKARSKRGFIAFMCLAVIPLANVYFYFLPVTHATRIVTVLTVSRSGLAISGWVHLSGFVLMTRFWWAWFRQRKLIYQSGSAG
ncbi:MAG: hypothetical protein Q8K62_13480 [Thiobacillus sp.]|nr:hypothetical protein [Thiobacillus sp.]